MKSFSMCGLIKLHHSGCPGERIVFTSRAHRYKGAGVSSNHGFN